MIKSLTKWGILISSSLAMCFLSLSLLNIWGYSFLFGGVVVAAAMAVLTFFMKGDRLC